jgi:hypothetical protein
MTVHMGTVTLVDTAPSVHELEWALQATCGALVTEDVLEVKVQLVQAIDAIRAAISELRPAERAAARAVVFGFVLSPDRHEVGRDPAHPVS